MTDKSEDLFGEDSAFFEKDAAPKDVEHEPFEARTKFYPWHKPRKHYLRKNQWVSSIADLVDNLQLKNRRRSLNYLSLPGPDLLDIRTIEPICQTKEVKLSFLGLNDGGSDDGQKHLNVALLNQVMALPGIDSMSDVVPDKFEHLSKKETIAYERVIASHRSFDVINVDLCGTLAEAPPGQPGPTLMNSVFNLVKHQAKTRTEDWLFFLTTRSNKDKVDQETMGRMLDWLNNLIGQDANILNQYIEYGFISHAEMTDGKIDISKISDSTHSILFTVGMGHWIFASLFNNEPAWRADLLPQYGYHVFLVDPACDMISMGFYCKPLAAQPTKDVMGIAHVPALQNAPDMEQTERNGYDRIHRRVKNLTDVDVKLHNEPELYKVALEESAALLRNAMYDETKYREFAEEERKLIEAFLKERNLVAAH